MLNVVVARNCLKKASWMAMDEFTSRDFKSQVNILCDDDDSMVFPGFTSAAR
jgi:hypothetical protein